jgi:pSer/pThr/pTyr-binding forkhead associated (FHA) protein
MDVKLLIKKGSNGLHEIPLTGPETLVGRQKGCKLRIPSGTVSRHHCRFLFEDERLFVEDLNSSNGTFVNGVRVHGRQLVQPGDEIEIGPVVFVANYLLVELGEPEIAASGVPLELVAEANLIEEVVPVEGIPLAEDESVTSRGKVAPADDAPVPVALVDEEEPLPPAILDEELTLSVKGDDDLRDLLSKMQ